MLQINASIAKHNERIWCAYRTTHLYPEPYYHYDSQPYLIELDNDLEPLNDIPLVAENNNTAFEDIRLFSFKNKLLAFYHYLPLVANKRWDIIYAIGFGEVELSSGIIKNQVSLRSLSKRDHEKNWAPYIYDEELYMVTDFDPFLRVIKIDFVGEGVKSKETYISKEKTKSWAFGELRGGTPLISEPGSQDGWIYGFVHSFRSNEQGFGRYYYHTVVRYNHVEKYFEYHPEPLPYLEEEPDEDYELLWRYSNSKRSKVIFPMGILHCDGGVMVSFGKDDVLSFTEYFSWERLKSFFFKKS